jgi:hypothetical protein
MKSRSIGDRRIDNAISVTMVSKASDGAFRNDRFLQDRRFSVRSHETCRRSAKVRIVVTKARGTAGPAHAQHQNVSTTGEKSISFLHDNDVCVQPLSWRARDRVVHWVRMLFVPVIR